MAVPSLGKFFIPATLTAGAVFSVLAAPLALFGSESVNIQFQGETFDGELKDLATPYLGLAGVLSLGAGVASIALTGWRQSDQQSTRIEQQLLEVQQQLREREVQIQTNFLSDKHLDASGLRFFLEDEVRHQDTPVAATARPSIQTNAPKMQPTVVTMNSAISEAVIPQTTTIQDTVSPLSAAQAFLSFSRPVQASLTQSQPPQGKAAIAQIEQISELQNQLQQILSQIEALQGNLMATPQPAANPVHAEDLGMIPQLEQRLKNLENQWVMQRVAS
ncbi:MAG: hypothetical protein LH660_09140 [Phormidesmis sp. CAN_BIN36]|nr:hypothetical protein [Phormidesmis sp. CAN_BIN36]